METKQSFNIKKLNKIITIRLSIDKNKYTNIKSIDLIGYKEFQMNQCRLKLILNLHSTAITDQNQFETFIKNGQVYLIVFFDKNTNEILQIDIDDILFESNDTNNERTAMFFHEKIEKELENLTIQIQFEGDK